MLADLRLIYATVDKLTEIENRDDSMLLEMTQAMINDLIETGSIRPVADYIAHYTYMTREECDILAAQIV